MKLCKFFKACLTRLPFTQILYMDIWTTKSGKFCAVKLNHYIFFCKLPTLIPICMVQQLLELHDT